MNNLDILKELDSSVFHLPSLKSARETFYQLLEAWDGSDFLSRLWQKDHALWFPYPHPEVNERLGWLDLIRPDPEYLEKISEFAQSVKNRGISHIILLGMGGSSLAPEVFAKIFGAGEKFPALTVLDTTHPHAVRSLDEKLDYTRSLFLVSSKSGRTLETLSLFRYFWKRSIEELPSPGEHFAAITDRDTHLESIAEIRGFQTVFLAPSDVGGRFSALSPFGLVPAALIGIDIESLLKKAHAAGRDSGPEIPAEKAPGIILGALLAVLSGSRNKLTFITSPSLAAFPDWLEQLIAESLGKDGKGLLPVIDEPDMDLQKYSKDRFFISCALKNEDLSLDTAAMSALQAGHPFLTFNLEGKEDLGYEIFRWELAVAAAGSAMKIQPFNQPDVQLAKDYARRAMEEWGRSRLQPDIGEGACRTDDPEKLNQVFQRLSSLAEDAEYIAIQAYLDTDARSTEIIQDIRASILKSTGKATTLGIGPRFLHSTGQLHKGGPEAGLFIQIVDEPAYDLPVPETGYSFGTLIGAQSLGDFRALLTRGKRVVRINLGTNPHQGLEALQDRFPKI